MPLLDIVGVDACHRSFCIAFAFLSGEEEEDYTWALSRLRSMYELCGASFPSVILTDRCLACNECCGFLLSRTVSLLCVWHANKTIIRHCQPNFINGPEGKDPQGAKLWKACNNSWQEIINSREEATYNERLEKMKKAYIPYHVKDIAYILETWLELYREKLVKAWIDQHPHFDNVTTSRTEGIHHLMKIHLNSSQLDLFEAWRSIRRALLNQIAELHANQAKQFIRTPIELTGRLYSNIRGWVSYEALR